MSTRKSDDVRPLHMTDAEISSPCPADMPELSADEKRRFCTICDKDVHNLSAMNEDEARRLIDTDSDMCVAYTVADNGDIVSKTQRPRIGLAHLMRVASLGMGLASLAGCDPIDRSYTTPKKTLGDKLSDQWEGLFRPKKSTKGRRLRGKVNPSFRLAKSKRAELDRASKRAEAARKARRAAKNSGSIGNAATAVWEDNTCIEIALPED